VSYRKMADSIVIWFGTKTRVDSRHRVLVGGAGFLRGRGNFGGCSLPLKCIRLYKQQMPTAAQDCDLARHSTSH